MNVLGINCVFHESSAALIVDGNVIAAAEEERFNRIKHGKPALVSNADALPSCAIAFCLQQASIEPEEIDLVAVAFDPQLRRETFQVDPLSVDGDWGSARGRPCSKQAWRAYPSVFPTCWDSTVQRWFAGFLTT